MKNSRPIRARIDSAAIRHNYRIAKQYAPNSRAWAVIDRKSTRLNSSH